MRAKAIHPTISRAAPDGGIAITLAVAGFARDQLAVTVEENQLVIRGKRPEADDKTFLHRGIAARQFLRAFVLADGIEVKSAALENGLLRIDLVRPQNQPSVRTIEITWRHVMTDNFESGHHPGSWPDRLYQAHRQR